MNLLSYDSYTNSNILWVGNYPSHWSITQVKYEAYVKARVGWHGLKSDDFTDEGPYLVTGSDFKSSSIRWQDCYHCDLKRYEQDPYIQLGNGDLLITKDGTIGKVALVQGLGIDDKATLNSGVFVVRPLMNNFSTKFYFWLLQSKVFTDFVDFNKTGSTIVHLYQDTFVNFSYASPQICDQLKISTFLDHETAKIDNLIEKQQQLIELLKEKRQAVISHAVTKGLNPNAPMKDSGVEWLGEVPEHWGVMQMRHAIVRIEQGKSPECEARNAEDDEWGVLKSGCVNGGLFNEKEHKALPISIKPNIENEVHPGELIMSRASGSADLIGSMAFIYSCRDKLLLSDKTFRVIPTKKILPEFLSFIMGSLPMRNQIKLSINGAEGLANNITKESIKSFYIVVPCFNEQVEIVSLINERNKIFEQLEVKLSNSLRFLQERRTALISAAVTGKIDVRNWVATEGEKAEVSQEATA